MVLSNIIKYHKMPKQNVDYSKTIIYKLVCKDLLIQDVCGTCLYLPSVALK